MVAMDEHMKNRRGLWDVEDMNAAAKAVLYGRMNLAKAAKEFMVPRTTLRRHIKKGGCSKKELGRKNALTEQQEKELTHLILCMKRNLFGLTIRDLRRLVFQYCFMKSIKTPFNVSEKMAGRVWVQSYMKRHKDIDLPKFRKKIATPKDIECFYNVLHETLYEYGHRVVPDANVYDVHEFCFRVNCQRPKLSGQSLINCWSNSALEDDTIVRLICCASSIGHFVPPMIMFPKDKMSEDFQKDPIPGAAARVYKEGEGNAYLLEWFQHFLVHVQPKHKSNKTILILDGQNFGPKSLELVQTAEVNNVIMISVPKDSASQIKPLVRTFYPSLSKNYNREVSIWSHVNPDIKFDSSKCFKLFKKSYCKSATVESASIGFQKSGIVPLDPHLLAISEISS